MAQYQSFPEAPGDSRTLDKLKRLALPELRGRSFLDVGCNEGFFCGFAKFAGAARVVGLDSSALFIDRAMRRFPECEFVRQGWEVLPEERFDVILLASALHYADDQEALVRRLVEKLSDDGVLVLELGIASAPRSDWIKVKRGIDERLFPTMAKVRELLSPYAWKWIGQSVSQDGDPVGRHVIHVGRRRPVSYLLMQPPAFGKSSIAGGLFVPAGVPVVSGDKRLAEIAEGRADASPGLRDLVQASFSPFHLDKVIQQVFENGLVEDLVDAWLAGVGKGDFAVDMYVPAAYQEAVRDSLERRGYLPVTMHWEKVGPRLLPSEELQERADAFYMSMGGAAESRDFGEPVSGFVDEVQLDGERLVVRGWAIDAAGNLPAGLRIGLRGEVIVPATIEKQLRNDVQKHLGLGHSLVGFRMMADVEGFGGVAELLGSGFAVLVPGKGQLRLAAPVSELRRRGRQG